MPSIVAMKRRLHGQKYEDQTFRGLDLSNASAFGSQWMGCLFKSCDLSIADFTTAKFFDCVFYDCDLPLARFNAAEMRTVKFEACRAKNVSFAGVTPLAEARFAACQMHYASFFETTARDVAFLDCNLHGADIRWIDGGASVEYTNSILWGATIQLGCQFLSGQFDERSADLFTAMVARRHPNEKKASVLRDTAGTKAVGIINRLMDNPEEEADHQLRESERASVG